MARDHVLAHPHLDAEHEVGVFGHRSRRQRRLRVVDGEQLGHRKADEPAHRDVHERELARASARQDEAAKRRDVVCARVAGRHHRGGAGELHQLVGGNADRRAVREGVRVQIDQPRRHQLAAGIEHAIGAFWRDAGLDRFDHPVANADVALAAQLLARVEHVGVAHQQIELVVRSHRREHCGGHQRAQGRVGASRQPLAPCVICHISSSSIGAAHSITVNRVAQCRHTTTALCTISPATPKETPQPRRFDMVGPVPLQAVGGGLSGGR